jgi:CRP/FNR family cyclic AMP-dependent transcriptional regulator
MNGADLFGYVASILVFGTFYMKRMLPLRLMAIASNVAFISYAWLNGLTPILLLHGALLPLNLLRLVEQRRLMAKARAQGRELARTEG